MAGLVAFGRFACEQGVDRELRRRFARLKSGRTVVYPMHVQMRLLIDAAIAGCQRILGLECLAADPLFVHLAGGTVPSIDTVYRDLERFDESALRSLESYVAEVGLRDLPPGASELHLDIDTTVEVLFGSQEGALPGPNPRYHGRPSYHPILARCAETGTIIGAALRPGDTGFGSADAEYVRSYVRRLRAKSGDSTTIYVRIDGAGDCLALMTAIEDEQAYFITKADMTADLCSAIAHVTRWETVDYDADGRPSRQVAEIPGFARKVWKDADRSFRVVAVRSRDRDAGKQIRLWEHEDYTVQAFITNERIEHPDAIAHRYDRRAGIEPLIGELKGAWAIGKVPSQNFNANHAALLLKLLAFNLLRAFARDQRRAPSTWRTTWLRQTLITVPGRLIRSGRSVQLRVRPAPDAYPHPA